MLFKLSIFAFFKTKAFGLLQTNSSTEMFLSFLKNSHIFSTLDPDPEANNMIFFVFNFKILLSNKIT